MSHSSVTLANIDYVEPDTWHEIRTWVPTARLFTVQYWFSWLQHIHSGRFQKQLWKHKYSLIKMLSMRTRLQTIQNKTNRNVNQTRMKTLPSSTQLLNCLLKRSIENTNVCLQHVCVFNQTDKLIPTRSLHHQNNIIQMKRIIKVKRRMQTCTHEHCFKTDSAFIWGENDNMKQHTNLWHANVDIRCEIRHHTWCLSLSDEYLMVIKTTSVNVLVI